MRKHSELQAVKNISWSKELDWGVRLITTWIQMKNELMSWMTGLKSFLEDIRKGEIVEKYFLKVLEI